MRKTFLILSLLAIGGTTAMAADGWERRAGAAAERQNYSTRAEDDSEDGYLVFGYCYDYSSGVGQVGNLKAAIEIPAETAEQWTGARLTRLRIGFGIASKSDITVYLSNSLNGEPFYTQDVTLETQDGWNEVTLDTPYDITGETFFIGYEFDGCKQSEYPIGIDDVLSDVELGDYVYVASQGWINLGTMYGSVCIRAIIEGDNLPQNSAGITDFSLPFSTAPETDFSATVLFQNRGTRTISTVGADVKVRGEASENIEVIMSPEKILPGEYGSLTINGLRCDTPISDAEVNVSLTEVNGLTNECTDAASQSGYMACFSEGVARKMVVEEWTGTWCGWCVRGIVGMEYMQEKYGDADFIGIAVHSDDRMQIKAYNDFLNKFAIIGFPGCAINRSIITDPNKQDLEGYYKEIVKTQSYAKVDELTASYSSENPDDLSVKAGVSFTVPVEDGDYRLAFVITEDGVGPYAQSNYYAGGSYGPMDGWEKYSSSYRWTFNEVARDIRECMGIEGSIPSDVEAGTTVEYSTTMSLRYVSILRHCNLVALIINGKTGDIINAGQVSLFDTSVENIAADGIAIHAGKGMIEVKGEYTSCEVFTTAGLQVGNLTEGVAYVPAGIYIVRATDSNNNVVTRKVAVR